MSANDAGKRSRSTETFLVAADVEAFSLLLARKIEGKAAWSACPGTCRGADLVHALATDGVQAHLRLTDSQGGLRGTLIQYLNGAPHIDGRESCPTAATSP